MEQVGIKVNGKWSRTDLERQGYNEQRDTLEERT